MAVRTDFTAGEVLAAADLNDTFASKPPFAYGTATPSTTVEGFIWYDENSTPPAPKFWDGAAFQTFGGGKILQIVRDTDTTERTTTSTSYVDVTGMSITITPKKSTSAIIVVAVGMAGASSSGDTQNNARFAITDASNNVLSGAEEMRCGVINITGTGTRIVFSNLNVWGYSTPNTTSATTYKLRMKSPDAGTTASMQNGANTGQLYAIEVAA